MELDIGRVSTDSFGTLINNRTVAIFVIIGVAFATALSAVLATELQPLLIEISSGTLPSLTVLESFASLLEIGLTVIIISYLFGIFIAGGVISSADAGSKADFVSAAKNSLERFFYLIATSILFSIIFLIGLVCLIIPGLYLYVRLCLAYPETVINKKGPIEALKSSWAATKGNELQIFAILAIVEIIVFVIGLMAGALAYAGAAAQIVGIFISGFFGYALIISEVLIYEALKPVSMPAESKAKPKAKK
jgi:hypothetical protein